MANVSRKTVLSLIVCRRSAVPREQTKSGSGQRKKGKDRPVWQWVIPHPANHIWLTFQKPWGEKKERDRLMNDQICLLFFLGREGKERAGRTEEEAGWGCKEEEGSHQHDAPVRWDTAEGQNYRSSKNGYFYDGLILQVCVRCYRFSMRFR